MFLGNFGFAVESDMETFLLKENEMKTFYDKINPNSLLIITPASVARPHSLIILTTAIKIPLMFFNVKISLYIIANLRYEVLIIF